MVGEVGEGEDVWVPLIPCAVDEEIRPVRTSPLNGRKTINRNSTTPPPISPGLSSGRNKKHLFTVDMRGTTSVTNHTLADLEDVPQADAEANIVDDLVRVFGVDLVFECVDRALREVLWVDYHEVGERGLCESLSLLVFLPEKLGTNFQYTQV